MPFVIRHYRERVWYAGLAFASYPGEDAGNRRLVPAFTKLLSKAERYASAEAADDAAKALIGPGGKPYRTVVEERTDAECKACTSHLPQVTRS